MHRPAACSCTLVNHHRPAAEDKTGSWNASNCPIKSVESARWLASAVAGPPTHDKPASGVNAVNKPVCGGDRPAAYSVTVNTADRLPSGVLTLANRTNYEPQCVTLGDTCIITVETDDCFLDNPLSEDSSFPSSVVNSPFVSSPSGVVSSVSAFTPVASGMFNHVQPIIDGLPSELTPEQRQRAIDLILANADVFSTHD